MANDKIKRLYSFFIYGSIYIFQMQNNNANNHTLLSKNKFNLNNKIEYNINFSDKNNHFNYFNL